MKKFNLTILTIAASFAFIRSAAAGIIEIQPPVSVPEGGGTFVLLTIGLIALAGVRRKLAK